MTDEKPWALKPMVVTITDKGETFQVADVQRWIDERKALLRRAREIMTAYNGKPESLYRHYGRLIGITSRLAEIKQIFDTFTCERARHADANIAVLVAYFSDPETMEGIDD